MIVCVCSNISLNQIIRLLDSGFSLDEIYERLKIGKDCGICVKECE